MQLGSKKLVISNFTFFQMFKNISDDVVIQTYIFIIRKACSLPSANGVIAIFTAYVCLYSQHAVKRKQRKMFEV
jgi:hypothetical protein